MIPPTPGYSTALTALDGVFIIDGGVSTQPWRMIMSMNSRGTMDEGVDITGLHRTNHCKTQLQDDRQRDKWGLTGNGTMNHNE